MVYPVFLTQYFSMQMTEGDHPFVRENLGNENRVVLLFLVAVVKSKLPTIPA